MSLFSDYLKISLTKDALLIRCLNDCQTSIADVKLSYETMFKSYTTDNVVDLFVSSSLLYKMLNVLDHNKDVELTVSDTNITIIGYGTNTKITYNLNGLHLDIQDITIPNDINYMVDITLPTKTLCDTIDNMMIIGDDCMITCTEDQMKCQSTGDNGTIDISILVDELEEYAIEEGGIIRQSYHLKLLHIISCFQKLSDSIYLKMSNDKPLYLLYKLDTNETSYIRFLVAPKIMDD